MAFKEDTRKIKTHHPLYKTFLNMKARCYNPNSTPYADYGLRGIKVCERWLVKEGFWNFVEDMGDKPTPEHSLDRINNDGNYEPSNCQWSTKREQVLNQRMNKNNKSGVTGVRWVERHQRWVAKGHRDGKDIQLGHYIKKEDAIKARMRYDDEIRTELTKLRSTIKKVEGEQRV
ncbi:MAG: AP2 domain-containing protein [Comamonadaceae bacterium]|nr:MAG: AP2 domain-containing protein [Comamonadaceae bacterium]